MRMVPVEGPLGKMNMKNLGARIARYPQDAVHHGRAAAITMTRATEVGSVYTLDEIAAIAQTARAHGLPLHMDGARFANALVALDTTPAEMTWKRGVDILSFGGTKNGCWCAEAIVFFNPEMARELPFIRKRTAQLFSKSRFIAAQFEAYLKDGLWLELATHANAMADRLRDGISGSNSARLAWPTQSNEVFAIVPIDTMKKAHEKGAKFYDWLEPRDMSEPAGEGEMLIRLVTSFASTAHDVDAFLAAIG